jgi:hypothetical protein
MTRRKNMPKVAAIIAMPEPVRKPPLSRNTAGLRAAMFDELEAFLAGKISADRIKTAATIANTIVDTARLELEFAKFAKTRNGANGKSKVMRIPPVRLAKRVAP